MASTADNSRASFVSKLVTDPKQPPNTLLLTGFLGASSEDGHRRLYFDAQLADYVEIPLRQTSCRSYFHADDPRRSDPRCQTSIRQNSKHRH